MGAGKVNISCIPSMSKVLHHALGTWPLYLLFKTNWWAMIISVLQKKLTSFLKWYSICTGKINSFKSKIIWWTMNQQNSWTTTTNKKTTRNIIPEWVVWAKCSYSAQKKTFCQYFCATFQFLRNLLYLPFTSIALGFMRNVKQK